MTNALINEDSTYLLAHAHNPVDWRPWGEEAFSKAKAENKPIFVSIGYSACHWCHVMEREVFENETLAKKLNEKFVSIKIDKEERPDLDKHFQLVYQLMAKRAGGWPTSIFLTVNKNPFYAATYIPPTPKHGINGFGELIDFLYERHQNAFEELDKRAVLVSEAIGVMNFKKPKKIDFDATKNIKKFVSESFDKMDGGINGEPKFLHAPLLKFMLDSNDEFLQNEALFTLSKMSQGGVYDIIDGGFCRYSVDSFWLVPHFEKMLYDNGALIGVYAKAYEISKDTRFLKIAIQTAEFLEQKMQSHSGAFYSASDADSNGIEGAYFVYNFKEAFDALAIEDFDENDAKNILKWLGFSKFGNFEGLNIATNKDEIQNDTITMAIGALKKIRQKREYPSIDTKLICSWNALAIISLFELGRADAKYLTKASRILQSIENELIVDGILYHCKAPNKTPKIEAFLEDYSFLAKAYLVGAKSTNDESLRQKAKKLAFSAKAKYYENGLWKFSDGEFITYADAIDSSYVSAISPICEVLLEFGDVSVVRDTLEMNTFEIEKYTAYNASLAALIKGAYGG